MKPSNPSEPFSRAIEGGPAAFPTKVRLTERQFEGLHRVAAATCPASRGSVAGGVAEAVRRAIDFWLGRQELLERLEVVVFDGLKKSISVRLTQQQLDRLDELARIHAARLDRIAAITERNGPQSYRGGLIRAAIAAYLARSPEARQVVDQGKAPPDMGKTAPSADSAKVKQPSK